jgi:translation initiation factor IF-3
MNDRIRDPELRVVTDDGEHLGIMPTDKALNMAKERDQDLVVIQPKAEPPVAKIIDYGKYKYEKDVEKRQQKAKQKNVEVKGVRLSLRIGDHDLNVRKEKAKEFLEQGNKVKIEIILRGREKRHGDLAKQVIENFIAKIEEEMPLKVDQTVTRQGGQLTSIVGKA